MPSDGGLGTLSVSTVLNSSLWTLWSVCFLRPGATGGIQWVKWKAAMLSLLPNTDKPFMTCDNNQNSV